MDLKSIVRSSMSHFIIVLGLFLIIDLPVILYLNNPMYMEQFKRINKGPNPTGKRALLSAMFAYLLLALGLYMFIVRPEKTNFKPDYWNIFIKGLIMGLVVYGVYNGTNMATISEWGTKEFIIDTVWGTILSGVLAVGSVYLIKLLNL